MQQLRKHPPLAALLLALALLATPALAGCGDPGAGSGEPDDGAATGAATGAASEGDPDGNDTDDAEDDDSDTDDDAPVLLGELDRAEVEVAVPEWVARQVESTPDVAAVEALTEVEPGAELIVYLGTWCSDSKRELSRLWRGFDDAGVGVMTELPFPVTYVGVDRDKAEPAERVAEVDLEYVPTFVVRRDGEEVGRVVEISPNGIEHDLLALLTGEAEGVVSGREDLGGAGREAILGSDDEDGPED